MPPTVASIEKELDKCTKQISAEYKECAKLVALYKTEKEKHNATTEKVHQVTNMHAKRVTQLTSDVQWMEGARANDPPNTPLSSEDYINADRTIQSINAMLDKVNKLWENEIEALDKMKAKIADARKKLGMSVGELEENLEDLKKVRGAGAASEKEKKAIALGKDMNKYVTQTLPPILR